jgi:hypothetical protein
MAVRTLFSFVLLLSCAVSFEVKNKDNSGSSSTTLPNEIYEELIRQCPSDCRRMCSHSERLRIAIGRLDDSIRTLVIQACVDHKQLCVANMLHFLCDGLVAKCFAVGYGADMLDACLASAMGSSRADIGPFVADSTLVVNIGVIVIAVSVLWYTTCSSMARAQ